MMSVIKRLARPFFILKSAGPADVSRAGFVGVLSRSQDRPAEETLGELLGGGGGRCGKLPGVGVLGALRRFLRKSAGGRSSWDAVVVRSLHPVSVAIGFLLSPGGVFLHNRWGHWYRIRLRTGSEFLRGVRGDDEEQEVSRPEAFESLLARPGLSGPARLSKRLFSSGRSLLEAKRPAAVLGLAVGLAVLGFRAVRCLVVYGIILLSVVRYVFRGVAWRLLARRAGA